MKSTFLVLAAVLSSTIAYPYHQHPYQFHHHKGQDVCCPTDRNFATESVDITKRFWVQESRSVLTCPFLSTTSTTSAAIVLTTPISISLTVSELHDYKSVSMLSALASGATIPPSSISECSTESPCKGDITYYIAGLGACGITDGDTEKVVALPHGLMGPESNDNPYCGKTITVTCITTGRTTTAVVADKCMGCNGFSIDLSIPAFLDLDDLAVGRTQATWYFN